MSNVTGRKMHGQHGAAFIQGFAAAAAIPTSLVNLAVKKWEAEFLRKEHDTGSTSTPDWESAQLGKGKIQFTIDAQLDVAQLPLGVSGIDLQADYAQVQLVQDQTAAGGTTGGSTPGQKIFDFTGVLTSIKFVSAENDIINYTITGRSTGTVIVNNGS